MDIVALYKTFDGGEFVDASLASVYDFCTAIVMVHSDVSWLGERGNTVKPSAIEWCNKNDRQGKVKHIDVSADNQESQYQTGIDYIKTHKIPCDVVMAIDADEVWEDQYIENAIKQISDRPYPAYRSNMHTYLKSPFFRVSPAYGSPTVFFREPKLLTESPRGCRSGARQLSDVWMHHYTYVRDSREAVERKIFQSCKADGDEKVVNGWMESIYDNLPGGRSLHAFERWRSVWHCVEKIWMPDIPPAMRSASLMKMWMPDGQLLDGEMNAIYRLAKGRNQAIDLGTYKGRSAAVLSLACNRVYSTDCYGDVEGSFADTIKPDLYKTMQDHSFEENKALAKRLGNLTVDSLKSAAAGNAWSGRSVDVVFVDDDHSESGVLSGVNAWLPHIKIGGMIIFHDNNEIHPGVQSAIGKLKDGGKVRFFDPGEYSGSIAVCEVVSK